jgi:site-specific recombinase XerD
MARVRQMDADRCEPLGADDFAPLFHAKARRPPGRPRGALTRVVATSRALGVHHFAFLRASLLNLDLDAAFKRYLDWGETTADPRHVRHRRAEILAQVLDAGRRLDQTLAPERKLTRQLELLRSDAANRPAVTLPTLDAWMAGEGMDPDVWSEAEALSEYKAAFGIDNLDAADAADGLKDPHAARVHALNDLQMLLAILPAKTDAVDAWFARPVVIRLRNAGIVALEDLVNFINVYGQRWYRQIAGVGVQRASRVVAWLDSQADALQLGIRARSIEKKTVRALRLSTVGADLVLPARFGLVPLERLSLPSELAGVSGVFRSHMANTLEATDDLQAIRRWLSGFDERPATARSYRKEVERFVLWCAVAQRRCVSSVSTLDCQAYRAFLTAVPAHWIHPLPVERVDPLWRPFRRQPAPASQKLALVIVQAMFEGLRDAGYLVANPMRAVQKKFALAKPATPMQRSFTEDEWAHVLRSIEREPAGPPRDRLRCVLELLIATGMRLDELASATRGDLRRESLPDLPDSWVLSVTGKGNKQRDVPIPDDVIELLNQHAEAGYAERDLFTDPFDSPPLIWALAPSVPQWQRGANGQMEARPRVGQGGAPLSSGGIYAVVKRFFARAALGAGAAGLDAERFSRASTHWMRHTFVRQALVDGAPIEVVRDLVGHASIDTTSLYSTQELARKIRAVRALNRRTVTRE